MTSFVTAISDPVAPLVGIAIFASVLVALGAVIGFSRAGSKRKQVANLLSRYGRVRGAGEVATLEKHVRQTRFSKAVRAYVDSVDEKFISASLRPSMLFWVLLQTSPAVLVFLISLALFRSAAFAAILALLGGYLIPRWFLKSRAQKRAVKFNDELPQVLQVLASALRSGLTLPQALKVVAEHDKTEVGVQFTQALTEVDYGADLQDALLRVAERMKSRDLKWLVAALEIQREVGGSLSGILDSVAATIRGRAEIAREIQVLSAEGRLSADVLLALPLLIFVVLGVIQPTYVQFFYTEPIGFALLGLFALLVTIGWFWLRRIVKVRV